MPRYGGLVPPLCAEKMYELSLIIYNITKENRRKPKSNMLLVAFKAKEAGEVLRKIHRKLGESP